MVTFFLLSRAFRPHCLVLLYLEIKGLVKVAGCLNDCIDEIYVILFVHEAQQRLIFVNIIGIIDLLCKATAANNKLKLCNYHFVNKRLWNSHNEYYKNQRYLKPGIAQKGVKYVVNIKPFDVISEHKRIWDYVDNKHHDETYKVPQQETALNRLVAAFLACYNKECHHYWAVNWIENEN